MRTTRTTCGPSSTGGLVRLGSATTLRCHKLTTSSSTRRTNTAGGPSPSLKGQPRTTRIPAGPPPYPAGQHHSRGTGDNANGQTEKALGLDTGKLFHLRPH